MQHERAKKLILRDSRTEKRQKELRRKIRAEKMSGEDPPAGRRAGGRRTCPYRGRSGKYLKKIKTKKGQKIAEGKTGCGEGEPGRENLIFLLFLMNKRLYFRQIQS